MEPHFRFYCSVWEACGVTTRCTLEKLQNRAIRIITDSSYDAPAKPILRQLRLPSIAEMIRQESAGMVYKAINGQAPTYLSSLFNRISAVTNRMLRNSNLNLRPPRMKSSLAHRLCAILSLQVIFLPCYLCAALSLLHHPLNIRKSISTFLAKLSNLPFVRRASKLQVTLKYLGVQLDEHLSWKEHIKMVTEKASCAIGLLKYAKKYLPIAVVKTLYSSIIEPHFQYCCSVWGCCNSTDILQLQRLQNRAARVLTNSQFDAPIKPLIQSLGWQTIGQLIDRQSKLTVFNALTTLLPDI